MASIPQQQDTDPNSGAFAITQNFLARYITALVLIPIGIYGMYTGGITWAVMMSFLATIGALEFYMLSVGRPRQAVIWLGIVAVLMVIVGFYLDASLLWLVALAFALIAPFIWEIANGRGTPFGSARKTLWGVLYVGLPMAFLIALSQQTGGFFWLVILFTITWATDTFAYFAGRVFGKRKLAPTLSPNKTVEGAIGGALGGSLFASLFLWMAGVLTFPLLIMAVVGPLLVIAGDLFESFLKRRYDVKDSHVAGLNVLPGHGGVLDRVDGLIFATLFCYPYMLLIGIF
jgi:phosphatidate cytidylyltransferase